MFLTTTQVRERFLYLMEHDGHSVVSSASLVPDQDVTTLFIGSGMQPLVPYLLGKEHPLGSRLTNSQRCLRAQDIEEVGDNRHTTFFEMLGNWSLGDYFKEQQIKRLFVFLTDPEKGLGLDPCRLYITVFSGDELHNLPRDNESADIWQNVFKKKGIDATIATLGTVEQGDVKGMQKGERIFYYDSSKNWWSRAGTPSTMSVGEIGGGCSEVFYDFGEEYTSSAYSHLKSHPNSDSGRFVEIANSVFMEYVKKEEGFASLPKKNVDFGAGLERLVAATQNNPDIFLIDSFAPLISLFGEATYKENPHSVRIVADHIRASAFIISDGISPSNTEAGYVLRRFIRRAVFHCLHILKSNVSIIDIVAKAVSPYEETLLKGRIDIIQKTILKEVSIFQDTLKKGLSEFEKKKHTLTADDVFVLFSSYGFPFELTRELVEKEGGANISEKNFRERFDKHKEVSRQSNVNRFKGGLSDTSDSSVRYHTATHLLYQTLREVLGTHVISRGSNITPERLRFDFSHTERLSEEEVVRTECSLNRKIDENIAITYVDMPREEAEKTSALCSSERKYTDSVRVYSIGDYGKEFCGGPHVKSTGEIGHIRIVKQESVGRGVRRIRAIFSDQPIKNRSKNCGILNPTS